MENNNTQFTEEYWINNHLDLNVGHSLRRLRESTGYTLEDMERMTGYSADKMHDIETGSKRINLHTFLRLVATYGGQVILDAPNFRMAIDEYEIPPFTPSSQKTDTDTPPVKKHRPRLDPSQSKNS